MRSEWTRPLVAVLLVGLVVLAGIAVYQQEQIVGLNNELSALRPPWLFTDAYAQYSDEVTYRVCNSVPPTSSCYSTVTLQVAIQLRVLGYNSTKVEMRYSFNQTTTSTGTLGRGGPFVSNLTKWVSYSTAPSLPPFTAIGLTFVNISSAMITLHNQTYDTTVYRYQTFQCSGQAQSCATFIVYVYQSVGFPIRYTFPSSTSEVNSAPTLNIDLTQTNIPDLTSLVSTTT